MYGGWEHDLTGDRIEVEPAVQTEYRSDGNPKEYQITLLARDGLRGKNPGGELVKTMREQRENMEYGEVWTWNVWNRYKRVKRGRDAHRVGASHSRIGI